MSQKHETQASGYALAQCPNCAGRGSLEMPGEFCRVTVDCSMCDGTGKVTAQSENAPEDIFDQWVDTCPKCNNCDCLTVYEVVLAVTHKKIYPESRLHCDGFDVDPRGELGDIKNQSTYDEKVRCDHCGAQFDLSDLFKG